MTEPRIGDDGNASTPNDDATTDESILAGHSRHTLADVREIYREQATMLGRLEGANRLLTRPYRQPHFQQARGRVLDVACGTATNALYVPDATEYVGIDISGDMLDQAETTVDWLTREENLREMNAQDLDFADDSFDSVISSLSTCTFPDPVAALSEMGRVCKPDGRILLLEHGRSSVGPIARFQDWRADAHFEKHSCRWNQEPLDVVAKSPLTVVESSSSLFGIITAIEARPV